MSAVLVTGAGGFVGLALVEALLARGEAVTALDAAPLPDAARGHFAALPGRLQPVVADARDAAAMQAAMVGADRMIIAAAVTAGPARERTAPEHVLSVNVQAVATAVRLAAESGLRRVVHLSSGSTYGTRDPGDPILTEDTPLYPAALYGISKMAARPSRCAWRRSAAWTWSRRASAPVSARGSTPPGCATRLARNGRSCRRRCAARPPCWPMMRCATGCMCATRRPASWPCWTSPGCRTGSTMLATDARRRSRRSAAVWPPPIPLHLAHRHPRHD